MPRNVNDYKTGDLPGDKELSVTYAWHQVHSTLYWPFLYTQHNLRYTHFHFQIGAGQSPPSRTLSHNVGASGIKRSFTKQPQQEKCFHCIHNAVYRGVVQA